MLTMNEEQINLSRKLEGMKSSQKKILQLKIGYLKLKKKKNPLDDPNSTCKMAESELISK